jgi:hypothetical protein
METKVNDLSHYVDSKDLKALKVEEIVCNVSLDTEFFKVKDIHKLGCTFPQRKPGNAFAIDNIYRCLDNFKIMTYLALQALGIA